MIGCWDVMKFLAKALLLIFLFSVFFSNCHAQATADKLRKELNRPKPDYNYRLIKSAEMDFYIRAIRLMDLVIDRLERENGENKNR
jgi:hypothetical protein